MHTTKTKFLKTSRGVQIGLKNRAFVISWVIRNLRESLLGWNYHRQLIFHVVLYFFITFFHRQAWNLRKVQTAWHSPSLQNIRYRGHFIETVLIKKWGGEWVIFEGILPLCMKISVVPVVLWCRDNMKSFQGRWLVWHLYALCCHWYCNQNRIGAVMK